MNELYSGRTRISDAIRAASPRRTTPPGLEERIMAQVRVRERRRENLAMLERMTPEQLAEIRRTEARIELERKRHKAGNLGYLRIGMIVVGAGCGLLTGLLCFIDTDPMSELKIIAAAVVGMGFFMFLEFLIELRLRRMEEK